VTTLQAIQSGPAKCIRGVWSRQKEMPVIPNCAAAGPPHWAQLGLVANDTVSQAILHRTGTTLWHREMTRELYRADCQGSLKPYCITLHETPYRELYCAVPQINKSPPEETQENGVEFSPVVAIYPLGLGKSQLLPKSDRKIQLKSPSCSLRVKIGLAGEKRGNRLGHVICH
jgi:hypothetical protein